VPSWDEKFLDQVRNLLRLVMMQVVPALLQRHLAYVTKTRYPAAILRRIDGEQLLEDE
jgi:hypothetical protein